ncbi:MAG: hypothetical protein KIT63_16760 [Rhodoferax sp.]|nr:hypothetical protein [Rhodoferax sp.]
MSHFRKATVFLARLLKRKPLPNPVSLHEPLAQAIEDAAVLVAFGAQSRRGVKDTLVADLIAARAAVISTASAGRSSTPEEEAVFWTKYDELAIALAPVSAHSIRSSMRINSLRFPQSLFTPTAVLAAIAIIVFLSGIVIQSFWVAGRELLDKADAVDAQRVELLKSQAKSEATRKIANAKLVRLTDKLCDQGGPCATKSATPLPVGSQALKAPDQAELGRIAAQADLLKDEIDDKASIAESLTSELADLNDRGRPITDLLKKWHSRIRVICTSNLYLDFLCLSEQGEDDRALEEAQAEVRRRESDLEDWRKAINATEATKKDEQKLTSLQATVNNLFLNISQRAEVQKRQKDIEEARRNAANAEALIQRKSAHEVRIILSNVATYIVPLMMGLLGSLAFLLQSMSSQLREHIYEPISSSSGIVRLCLGAIAGVFGALALPNSDTVIRSLPPLFVPFVFGYGIEILFSLLNRIVSTFTQSDNLQTKTG